MFSFLEVPFVLFQNLLGRSWQPLTSFLKFHFISLTVKTMKWLLFLEINGNSLRSRLKLNYSKENLWFCFCPVDRSNLQSKWFIYLGFSDYKGNVNSDQNPASRFWLCILEGDYFPPLTSTRVKMGKFLRCSFQFSKVNFLFTNDDAGLKWAWAFCLFCPAQSSHQMPKEFRVTASISPDTPRLLSRLGMKLCGFTAFTLEQ